ncbi:MAG: GMC family oxidoreductase, partial [Gillisia sp.]
LTLKIRSAQGETVEINAAKFVIAAGSQESTRLLLRNLQVFKNLKKVPQALGKYYQGHLSGKIASVIFNGDPEKTEFGFIKDEDGVYLRRRFQFKTDFLVKKNLLNTAIWLDNPLYHQAAHKNGAMSLMYLLMILPFLGEKLAPPAIKESITKGKVEQVGAHVLNVAKDFPISLLKPAEIFLKRYLTKRKLPGVFLFNKKNTYALHFHSEQIPLSKNKMKLAEDGETLEIEYSLCDKEIESVIRLHKELDKHLQKNNCGKLEYWYEKDQLNAEIRKRSKDGLHQVGTIRIADGPDKGVVDRNLKVFGCENLYVCSSAVFPTSSQANPTFYLGAFAARLAQHLNGITNEREGEKHFHI